MINPNMDRRVPLCDPNEKEISPFIKTFDYLDFQNLRHFHPTLKIVV